MSIEKEMPLCNCGCGGRVTLETNKYIKGHQFKKPVEIEEDDFAGIDFYSIRKYQDWLNKKGMFEYIWKRDLLHVATEILIELKKLNGGIKDGK